VYKVTLYRAWFVLRRVTVDIPSSYVTIHLGQLSLLPSAVYKMGAGQGAVAEFCCLEDNCIFGDPAVSSITPENGLVKREILFYLAVNEIAPFVIYL